jgi:tetratricopeptide (TPR) repeat protein
MISLENATTEPDFAYCCVKRLPAYHIYLLRDLALQYGSRGTTEDNDRAVAILDEVRQEQRRGLRKYENMVTHPRLAADYDAIGRHDISLDIIEETLQYSRSLLVRWQASIYTYVATVCADIGEYERCDLLLRKVAAYIETVPRFGTSIVNNYWLGDLFALYLRLGMVDAAESLAFKMSGNQRTESLLTLAFHGQADGKCNESLLCVAVKRPSESGMAMMAGFFIQNCQFDRATVLLDQITNSTYLRDAPLLQLVACMFQRGDASGALELLERLLATPRAVAIGSEHLGRICAQLDGNHGDMLHRVLDHVSRAVQMNRSRLRRLAGMAKLVGVLASYLPDHAEDAVDQLFDACMAEIERGKGNVSDMSFNTVPVALNTVVLDIDRYGLRWDEERRERFRLLLGRIPVPRAFEFVDLFRAKIAV